MCLRALDRFCRSASGLQLHIFAISSFSYPSISFSRNTCCCRGGRWSTICCISSMSSFPSVHSCSAASSLGRLLSAHSIFLCRQWSIATPLIIFIANSLKVGMRVQFLSHCPHTEIGFLHEIFGFGISSLQCCSHFQQSATQVYCYLAKFFYFHCSSRGKRTNGFFVTSSCKKNIY